MSNAFGLKILFLQNLFIQTMENNGITQLITSEDGSHTLYVPSLNEHYHSIYGAIQESEHVYIRMGLQHLQKNNIRVLEIGFGTGLNALLTYAHSKEIQMFYQTVEKYPVDLALVEQINYGDTLGEPEIFQQLHTSGWNAWETLSPTFSLLKWKGDFRLIDPEPGIDLVYFDAFGPDKHPDLWSIDVFAKIYDLMNPNAILVTYCAKGSIQRMLTACGFVVERLPGSLHKREMVRAIKKIHHN